jgi:hypothetical protein
MTAIQVLLLVLVSLTVAGCEVAGGIFKAGAWLGAIAVAVIVAVVGLVVVKLRR